MRLVRKPYEVEAVQFDGANHVEVAAMLQASGSIVDWGWAGDGMRVTTRLGTLVVTPGMWVVVERQGESYFCTSAQLATEYQSKTPDLPSLARFRSEVAP